jgi:hypothetical protein
MLSAGVKHKQLAHHAGFLPRELVAAGIKLTDCYKMEELMSSNDGLSVAYLKQQGHTIKQLQQMGGYMPWGLRTTDSARPPHSLPTDALPTVTALR